MIKLKKRLSISVLSLAVLPLVVLLAGCSDNKEYETAICALADISGTYAKEKKSMVNII